MRNPCDVTNRLRISYRCTKVALEDFASIVAGRHVTERRQVIGILRSIGYRRQDVLVGLLVESAALTTGGMALRRDRARGGRSLAEHRLPRCGT
jgi:hypothetical protein